MQRHSGYFTFGAICPPSDDLRLLHLSELPHEFDVEETLCINISEDYLEILRILGKNETVLEIVRLSSRWKGC